MVRRRLAKLHVGQNGFTLLELVATVALVTLIAGMAMPSLARTLDNIRLRAATQRFASDVRLAQGRAQRYARPVRLALDVASGSYRIEQARTASAKADCTTAYDLVATVDLQAEYQAVFQAQTFDCIVFEASGRPGWVSPKVLSSLTTIGVGQKDWTRYLNLGTAMVDSLATVDAQTIHWIGHDEVTVTVDLGAALELEWICPSLVSNGPELDDIPFPSSFRLEIAALTGGTPPGASDWTILKTVTDPYEGVFASETGQWHTVCPAVPINRSLRYLRYVFQPAESPLWGLAMALDEIKLSPPRVALENVNGRGSRTVTIARVTGKVSIE